MASFLPRKIIFATFLAVAGLARAVAALDQGLVAHLPMQTDLRDHAAKPHPVEISGRVVLRDGAAFFGGKEDWLELPFIPLNDRPFAVAVWLKPTGAGRTYGVLEQWDRSETGHILHLMIRDGLRPWFGFYINDVVSPVSLSNAGDWQHVVFRYEGTHQEIWINGRLICRRSANAYRGTAGKTCIGKNPNWNNVPGKDYEGWMSDFRIYDRAISFEEIVALASARPAPIAAKAPVAAQPPGSVAPAGVSDVPLLSLDADKLRLRGKPGEEYVVEASEDLNRWEEIGNLTVGADGLVDFVDEDAHLFRQRFYRIRYRVVK
ncbi:MAG: hypothetical protein QOE70_683 [Chthoniobacter sp.]|jgi:hypothetical protein|nr:hypothetical protein [Chthoniobacter sp.]